MTKKILSVLLVFVIAIAFSAPALASSTVSFEEKFDEEIIVIDSLQVTVTRNYTVSQTIPGSITHSENRFGVTYIGTLYRTHVKQEGQIVTATFSGLIFPTA